MHYAIILLFRSYAAIRFHYVKVGYTLACLALQRGKFPGDESAAGGPGLFCLFHSFLCKMRAGVRVKVSTGSAFTFFIVFHFWVSGGNRHGCSLYDFFSKKLVT